MTPALVLGNPHHTTLQVIRALALSRIPQFTIGADKSFVSYSRWFRQLPSEFGNDPTPKSLAEFLERLPAKQMVLIPCSDAWVAAVSGLKPALAARFPTSIAPPEAIDTCLDKGRFAETMVRLGLPHPRTILGSSNDDLRALWNGLRDPFLKPRNSIAFSTLYQKKALRVETLEEALTRIQEVEKHGLELILQEYVPGTAGANFYVEGFVDRMSNVCALFARRRVRGSVEAFNSSSCLVSISLEEAKPLLKILDRLLPALRYRGIFSAFFKYDERDALFKLIEVNTRPWATVSLPVSCGINVVEMAYRDALGFKVSQVTQYPVGRYLVHAPYDRSVCWQLFWRGRLNVRAWLRTRVGAVQTIFRWDDPLPAIVSFAHRVARGIRRAVKGNAIIRRGATG